MKTSDHLTAGAVYSRNDLKIRFDITDATINTGVFRPKGHDSVWLFVTEHKSADRTQYADRLESDSLFWQGQMSGRSDPMIIQHASLGLELLLFYRRKKYEFPAAGFRFQGVFRYVSHFGRHPTSFLLHCIAQAHVIAKYIQGQEAARLVVEEPEAQVPSSASPETLNNIIAWLASSRSVTIAEFRLRLLPLDLLPAALIDELNERALDQVGEIALQELGDEIVITQEVLSAALPFLE